MKKAAILLARGFEESEMLTTVDILRRAGIVCHMISTGDLLIEGAHNVIVKADALLNDNVKDYDMLILPGGIPGAANLEDDEKIIDTVKYYNKENKFIAAICAAPTVLAKADILKGRTVTVYPGYEKNLGECNYVEDNVVVDNNIITGQGPANVYAFAYQLVDILGLDSEPVKQRMLYRNAFDTR